MRSKEVSRETSGSFGDRYVRSLSVVTITTGISAIGSLASLAALSLLLGHREFGIAAVVLTVVALVDGIGDFGLTPAIVSSALPVDKLARTAYLMRLGIAGVSAILLFASSPFIAGALNEPQLIAPLQVASVYFLLSGVGFLPQAAMLREFKFRERAVVQSIQSAVSASLTIVLLLMGLSYWSAVLGRIAGAVALGISANLVRPVPLSGRANRGVASQLFSFGSHVMVVGIMGYVILNAGTFTIGAMFGIAALAYFSFGFKWGQVPTVYTVSISSQVLLPTLAQIREQRERVASVFLRVFRILGYALMLPVSVILPLCPSIVAVVFGNTWLPAVGVLQIVLVHGVFYSLTAVFGPLILSHQRPGINTRITIIMLVTLLILLFPLAGLWSWNGAALALLCSSIVGFVYTLPVVCSIIPTRPSQYYGSLLKPLLCAILAGLVAYGLALFLAPSWAGILLSAGLAASAYVGALALLDRGDFDAVLGVVRTAIRSPGKRLV